MVGARVVFWVLWFVRSAGMGFGDVRLSALLGFVLAYLGWPEYALGLYSGFVVFGLPGLLLAIVRWDRKLLKKAYPFGPFLLLGALLGILFGDPILGDLALG
jgi:leader peptidase (prepilin peptidase)/N-methyltransferase